jgi:hypothetical protein
MKENLLKLIDELSKRKHLSECTVSLTLNYKNLLDDFRNSTPFKNRLNEIISLITNSDNITSYNFTIKKRIGLLDFERPSDWQEIQYIFYSGDDENIDITKYASYNFLYMGNGGSREYMGSNGLMEKLLKYSSNERPKEGNNYEHNKVGILIDSLIELELLLDKQQLEKEKIFNKIKLYL